MPGPSNEGITVSAIPFRDNAAVGVMSWRTLTTLVPDPVREETYGARRAERRLREYAALRASVQRLLKGTSKGKNVKPYASYIAHGVRGDLGDAWSTPPLCLWSARPLTLNDGANTATLVPGVPVVAIDAETQVAAMHEIWNDPDSYEIEDELLDRLQVAFEIYWDISTPDARQIFHDRNLRGVPVAKTLALSMDQRDFGTTIAQQVLKRTEVDVHGVTTPLATFVNTAKRQLGQKDQEWITLSALRSLAVTTLLGRGGIEATSGSLEASDLPQGLDQKSAIEEVAEIITSIVVRFTDAFADRSAITSPAVLAGIGVAAHRTTSWSTDRPHLSRDELLGLLSDICWDREPKYWEGVAAKRTARGTLSFAGGAKDSGHRVCDAILNPETENGKMIRGNFAINN